MLSGAEDAMKNQLSAEKLPIDKQYSFRIGKSFSQFRFILDFRKQRYNSFKRARRYVAMEYPDVIVIGIAGGTSSGKSTMIGKIKKEFGDVITILSHDFYYKRHDELSLAERRKLNYDHPDSFDTDLMIDHIKMLKRWQPIDIPVYDFSIYNRLNETVHILPSKVIVVEGLLIILKTRNSENLFVSRPLSIQTQMSES